MAANARVVTIGYSQLFNDFDSCSWLLSSATREEMLKMNELAKVINSISRTKSHEHGFLYGDVDAKFHRQSWCTPGTNGNYGSVLQYLPSAGSDTGDTFYKEPSLAHPAGYG